MCDVFFGRNEPCLDNIGGLKSVYLYTYIPYRKYEISEDGTTLLKFPDTDIYRYELRADGNTFGSTMQKSDDGTFYQQKASLVLKNIKYDQVEITSLLNKRVGCIVENRNGKYQIMGLYNGCRVKSVKGTTGGARNSFNGYSLEIEANEQNQPFFIQDLEDAGFDPVVPDQGCNYLLQENSSKILQENNFGICLDERELQMIAHYRFRNNLVDDINGYNLNGQNISYNIEPGKTLAVFNGVDSEAKRLDSGGIFSFTDGTNDLPFRIETSIKFNAFTNAFQFIVKKRDSDTTLVEWQFFQRNSDNTLGFALYSGGQNVSAIVVRSLLSTDTNTIYNVVIEYDGSKTLDGLNMKVNGVLSNIKEEQGNYTGMSKTGASLTLGIANFSQAFDFDGQIDYLKIYK